MSSRPIAARWIWHDRLVRIPWNQYALFRRSFVLPSRPRGAVARISADARYRLIVNGTAVHFGPARSFPARQCLDQIDLSPWLKQGENVVAAIAHQYGVGTFQSVWRESSGFLFDCIVECDATTIELHTPGEWLCRSGAAWKRDVARMTIQLGFQEHYSAAEEPVGWMSAGYGGNEESGWRKPHDIGPAGTHPWLQLAPRSVPPLTQTTASFARLAGVFLGRSRDGFESADDIYKLVEAEAVDRTVQGVLDAQNAITDDDSCATIQPTGDGQFTALLLEVDGYCTGHLNFDIADAAAGTIIDIVYNEALAESGWMHFNSIIGGGGQTAGRYICRAGRQTWETFHFIGMRYAALVFRNVTAPLKLRRVGLTRVHADVQSAGSFECSDDTLNQIWQMCRRTQLACLLDAFVDCPWREQAMWWGDARVQALVTAHAFGDTSILEHGIRLLAQSQAEDGSLHAHPPSDWRSHRLPDFMCTWVGTLWDHYWLTGRTDLIKECLPAVHRLFEFLASHAREDGLIGGFDGWWVFLDWAALHKDDYSAVLNLHYLQAALHAMELCRLAGDDAAMRRYGALCTKLDEAIVHCFWDETAGLFRDGIDPATGARAETTSQQANTLAILIGLRTAHHHSMADNVLLKSARDPQTAIVTSSPFFYAYVFQALCRTGRRSEAIDLIRDKWGGMIGRGFTTCIESWKPMPLSHCHAWSASPLYHLMQQVLGVSAVEAGWKKVRIDPLCGGLGFARGAVPTPHGSIAVDWKWRDSGVLAVRIDLPEGVQGEFVAPGGVTRDLSAGTSAFECT